MLGTRLTELLDPVVRDLGYELVLLEYSPQAGGGTLRLFIDTPEGVGLGDCEKVSREVAALLDVEDVIPHAYRLEVSSPGLDRPLVKPEHFARFRGQVARVQMMAPIEGRKRFSGLIDELTDGALTLETPEGRFVLPLADIERARLVADLPKAGAKPGPKVGAKPGTKRGGRVQ